MIAYFVVASLFFYTGVPVYAIPHGALGLEMTEDYHEKTGLFAYASFIGNVGAFTLPWVYFSLMVATMSLRPRSWPRMARSGPWSESPVLRP
jgi:Na+/melibiose symporter-like transporter